MKEPMKYINDDSIYAIIRKVPTALELPSLAHCCK